MLACILCQGWVHECWFQSWLVSFRWGTLASSSCCCSSFMLHWGWSCLESLVNTCYSSFTPFDAYFHSKPFLSLPHLFSVCSILLNSKLNFAWLHRYHWGGKTFRWWQIFTKHSIQLYKLSLCLCLFPAVCNEDYPCEGMSRHATFENFGMAFLTLFQVSTGDNWNGIMKVQHNRKP